MPTPDEPFVVRRVRFDTEAWLIAESTFLTETELNGIWEKQGRLPLDPPPEPQPIETAGPLFQQPQEGEDQ
jgi:hypothetical protein